MRRTSHGFANQLLICALVTICCGGSVGVGTVWMRNQISTTANTNRILSARLAELKRQTAETQTLVAMEQSLDALHRRNAAWQLGLEPMSDSQVIHVTEDTVRLMAARANRGLFRDATNEAFTDTAPVKVTFPLPR
jgi:hypothetical protein